MIVLCLCPSGSGSIDQLHFDEVTTDAFGGTVQNPQRFRLTSPNGKALFANEADIGNQKAPVPVGATITVKLVMEDGGLQTSYKFDVKAS